MKRFMILLLTFSTSFVTSRPLRAQDSVKPKLAAITAEPQPKPAASQTKASNATTDYGTWALTFLPVALTFCAFTFFLGWLRKENYNLSDALSGCDPVTLVDKTSTVATPLVQTEVTRSVDTLPRSTSRLVAFMTGITAIICAISFLSLFIYAHLSGTDNTLQFDGIWKVMAGLGVGVIPYGFNMWKEKTS